MRRALNCGSIPRSTLPTAGTWLPCATCSIRGRFHDDAQVSSSLRQAAELYVQAARQLQVISMPQRLEHDLLDRAADYVEWYNLAPVGSSAPVPANDTLVRCSMIWESSSAYWANRSRRRLRKSSSSPVGCRTSKRKIESDLRPAFVASLLASPGPVPWNAGMLLATPLPSLAARLRLLASIDRLDRPLEPVGKGSSLDPTSAIAGPVGEHTWSALQRRADLQLRLARLAMIDCPHGQRPIENLEARASSESRPRRSANPHGRTVQASGANLARRWKIFTPCCPI